MNTPTKSFKFYQDPGHGWVAVKLSLLAELKICGEISPYSYHKGDTVYLEEDCDATRFFDAFVARYGVKPVFESRHTNKQSPIRSYQHYSKDIQGYIS